MRTFVFCMFMHAVSKVTVRTRLPQNIILVLLYICALSRTSRILESMVFRCTFNISGITGQARQGPEKRGL